MKLVRFIALLMVFALFTGCQAQLNREYSSIKRHEEQFEVDQHSDALTAENYLGLKNAILSFVETGEDYGVLRIYEYDGNVVSDLANAVYEVCHNDPLGAYMVDYMTYDYAHIVSYYEVYIYTTFRIAPENLDAIIRCSSSAAVEAELETALLERKYQLALRISNYSELDPEAIMHRIFMAHPELGISEPSVFYQLYPESGIQRIMEVTISYPVDILMMRSRQSNLAEKADELLSMLSVHPQDLQKVQRMYRWFVDHVTYMGEDSALFASAYNALVNEYASSLGVSLAVQLLCDSLDIPCFIVEGSYADAPWHWNMIYLDELWQHIDIARGMIDESRKYQAAFDSDMIAYTWDSTLYPACPAPEPEESIDIEPDTPIEDPLPPAEDPAPDLIPYPDPDVESEEALPDTSTEGE